MRDNFAKITDPLNPQSHDNKIAGWVPGIVIDNNDPEKIGRVRVQCPLISPEPLPNGADGWVHVATLYTLPDNNGGTLFPMEVGTQVILLPMMGDINQLIIVGALHSRVDRPYHEFDRHNGVTGEVRTTGKVFLSDDSPTGNGAEVKLYPSGTIERVDKDGTKTIETEDGAVLQLDRTGGVRIENDKGFMAISPQGDIEQVNQSGAGFSLNNIGDISINSSASPSIVLSPSGVDVRSQKDELTDIKVGLEKSFSGAFAGTYKTIENLESFAKFDLDDFSISKEYLFKRLDEILETAELNFENFELGKIHLDKLQSLDPVAIGEKAVAQLDFYRSNGLDKVADAITANPNVSSGIELKEIIKGAVPANVFGKLNINEDFLDAVITRVGGDVTIATDGILGEILGVIMPTGGGFTDIETLFGLGITRALGELGLSRNLSDLITGIATGDRSFELSDIGMVLSELGIVQEIMPAISSQITGITDAIMGGLDEVLSVFSMVDDFIAGIDQMIVEFINFPLPFSISSLLSDLIQKIGILDKAKGFIDQIKGKIEQIEGLIDQFIDLKNDTSLAEGFGNQVLENAGALSSIVGNQENLKPRFQASRKLSSLLVQLQDVDTVEELLTLRELLDEIDTYNIFDTKFLRELTVEATVPTDLNSTRIAIDDFLKQVATKVLPQFVKGITQGIDKGRLIQGNQYLLDTTNKIAITQGAVMQGNQDFMTLSSDNYQFGATVKLEKDLLNLAAPGGDRGFAPTFSMDKDMAVLKSPGCDLGLGCFMKMEQANFNIGSPGSSQGLGSSFNLDQKHIFLKAPGAETSVGSFIELDQDDVKIYGPGGDKGLSSNILVDLKYLRLNGPGENNKSKNNAFLNLTPNSAELFAPGGATFLGSELRMSATQVHCRSGSELPTDLKGRLSMTPLESSLFAPYNVIFNSFLTMNPLFADLNGGNIAAPNSNLYLGTESLILSKRQALLPTSMLSMTDLTIDMRAGLIGSTAFLGPETVILTAGVAGSIISMFPSIISLTPAGGSGIFIAGPLIFIN